MLRENSSEVPSFAPRQSDAIPKVKTTIIVFSGNFTCKGISEIVWNEAIARIDVRIPERQPKVIADNVLETSSQIITREIQILVHPIDLNTPSSHMLSLMFALIVIISQNIPKTKQIADVHIENKSTILRLAFISSFLPIASRTIMQMSSFVDMIAFETISRCSFGTGLFGTNLQCKASFTRPLSACQFSKMTFFLASYKSGKVLVVRSIM